MSRSDLGTVGMPLSEHIVVDPEIPAGKPVIRGTRLAVKFILDLWHLASLRTTFSRTTWA